MGIAEYKRAVKADTLLEATRMIIVGAYGTSADVRGKVIISAYLAEKFEQAINKHESPEIKKALEELFIDCVQGEINERQSTV